MNLDFLYGLLQLSALGYVLWGAALLQLTIMAVTLYLHRDAAHRSLDLHPVLRHFFRFWIWATSGQITREWVAVHRKHHAYSDRTGDPHSPVVFGIKKVLLEGYELYYPESRNAETHAKFGADTVNDWVERKIYSRYRNFGILFLILVYLALFGAPGIILIAVQLAAMPVLAAGIINGLGHHTGYRNYECDNAARNIVPWGLFIGGEELHNNHHAFPTSAKFSSQRWEFDIGWFYIKIFSALGLARVRRVAPQPVFAVERRRVDLETVRAVITNRMHVLRDYKRLVTLPVLRQEWSKHMPSFSLRRAARRLLTRHPALLDGQANKKLAVLLQESQMLTRVHEYRDRLRQLWEGRQASNERLIDSLREWCSEAEASGIKALEEFARRLSSYCLRPAVRQA
ncbi:MAG TPA: fatty acid desaturase [Steroidobacteraceae bacterium]|nr:fatty acid desaturase [Steroidobacteraceae bacterium]